MTNRIDREIAEMKQRREVVIEQIVQAFQRAHKTVAPIIDREAKAERVPAEIMNLRLD